MLIKEWSFDEQGTAPDYCTPFTHRQHEFEHGDSIHGQGNPSPPNSFDVHFLVLHGTVYYDPSYGGATRSSLEAWEDSSLDGFMKVFREIIDGEPEYVLAGKRNTSGQETQGVGVEY